MGIFNAIFQGIIQGLTEFLPVSSSGHLSLYQHFTGKNGEGALFFTAVLHLGTLVAVFVAFWDTILPLIKEFGSLCKDIVTRKFSYKNMNPERRMIVMIFFSCLCLFPFAVFKNWFESIAEDAYIFEEGLCFLYTAAILFMSDRCKKGSKTAGDIKAKDAVTVGLFQGVAMLPGVSRSGSTICSGLFSGFSRDTAVKYSFILGIPVILVSCLSEVKDAVAAGSSVDLASCAVGFVVSAVVGLGAIKLVNWLVRSDRFRIFGYYTLCLGVVVLIASFIEFCMGHPIVFG